MQQNLTPDTLREQPPCPSHDSHTVEDLGAHIGRLAALLRAAMNTDPDDHSDQSWLVAIACQEVAQAEACYDAWGNAPRREQA